MKPATLRAAIVGIFLSFLSAGAAAFAVVRMRGRIYDDELQDALLKLLSIYAVHLAVVFGAVFAQPKRKETASISRLTAAVSLGVALLWNILLSWRTFAFAFVPEDSLTAVIKYMDGVSAASSFLVTGMLAFIFTRRE